MSPFASADAAPSESSGHMQIANHELDVTEPNHTLPARTIVEGEGEHLERKNAPKDDPATMAASEELKHTTISDKLAPASHENSAAAQPEHAEDKDMKEATKEATPEADPSDAQDEEMRERISSPKKKRGRDQDDEIRDLEDNNLDGPGSSAEGGAVNGNRTTRSGPEKKRPRDTSEDYTKSADEAADLKVTIAAASTNTSKANSTADETSRKVSDSSQKGTFGSGLSDKTQTSASAFASSGFASLAAASTSPFGSLGASKPSIFGGTAPPVSGFGALASGKTPSLTSPVSASNTTTTSKDKPATLLSFGGGNSSGFGGLGTGSVFGASLGNGFTGGSGPKLSSFAAPGKENVQLGSKPAKAFGAPESDEDEGSDDDNSEGEGASDDEESGHIASEDKKKAKVTKVPIEDGESGETTLLQLRAKLFALESKEAGWKERGVGTLKINVPTPCASFDENEAPIPGSFDISGLEDEDADSNTSRVPRLIMRQENTHRVILNTVVVRAMEFKDKPSTTSAQILFTAFEGEKELKPINMLFKMSEANAKLFRSEIDSIQHEL